MTAPPAPTDIIDNSARGFASANFQKQTAGRRGTATARGRRCCSPTCRTTRRSARATLSWS